MWNLAAEYMPDWKEALEAFVVLIVPLGIAKFFGYIRQSEEE
ncbi:hypothetical protein ACFPVX_11955 [Cohnella faecalis]|nr:hypothetical protein [Cohnella faecalis]